MRIRNILLIFFLVAALVPSILFEWWAYKQGVKREFDDVKDHHLLLAQNIATALENYHQDLITTIETIDEELLKHREVTNLKFLMRRLKIEYIMLLEENGGAIQSIASIGNISPTELISPSVVKKLASIATDQKTVFSTVSNSLNNKNVIYGVRRYGLQLAIAQIGTENFVKLGKSISFGKKGHAAIVDQEGNILAHPRPEWIKLRKNISKVSAVKRMMNGETGMEQFYSPALKSDMIAGLTFVKEARWGVMVPQPVSEIYEKVRKDNLTVLFAIILSISLVAILFMFLIRSLAMPVENLTKVIKLNAKYRKLKKIPIRQHPFLIKEFADLRNNYNDMVVKISKANQKIELQAFTDMVTGLPNRDKFKKVANIVLEKNSNGDVGGVIVLIDLDNFKEINDLHGHHAGDVFLQTCAAKLLNVSKNLELKMSQDPNGINYDPPCIARIGGDEFTILVPGLIDPAEIVKFLNILRLELSIPSGDMAYISECGASIGCVSFPKDGCLFEDLIKLADIAMYHAKKSGKNKYSTYNPEIGLLSEAEIRRDVLVAIDNDELMLEYQPKICTRRSEVIGVEALVRWNHRELGRLAPDKWLPAIVNSPVVGKLGEWVTNKAIEDHNVWTKAGHDLTISVNIGSKHFISPGFVDKLEEDIKRNGLDSSKMDIEVTEDAIFASEERAEIVLNRLHKLGYSISIDDFGKGYSNIARLSKLPVDVIKIDRSMVVGGHENIRIKKIMAATISMAAGLGCKTVAEGVETFQQAEFATNMGVDMIQGYYFARAMGLSDLIKWLDQSKIDGIKTLGNQDFLKIAHA